MIRVIVYVLLGGGKSVCVYMHTHAVSFASLCWDGGLNLAGGFEQNSEAASRCCKQNGVHKQ